MQKYVQDMYISVTIETIQKHSVITRIHSIIPSYSIFLCFYNCFSRKLLLKIIASADDILWKSKACFIHYSRSTFSNILSNEIHSYSSFCINHCACKNISYSKLENLLRPSLEHPPAF